MLDTARDILVGKVPEPDAPVTLTKVSTGSQPAVPPALLFATVLVNLAPDNPYLINTQ